MRVWFLRLDLNTSNGFIELSTDYNVKRVFSQHENCGLVEIRPGAWIETKSRDPLIFILSDTDPNKED